MPQDIRGEYTLKSVMERNNPKGGIYSCYDLLDIKRPFIEEAFWKESSEKTFDLFFKNGQNPMANTVMLNRGAPYKATTETPSREELTRMETNMRIDTRAYKKSNDPAALRVDEERKHFRGFIETVSRTLLTRPNPTYDATNAANGPATFGDKSLDPLTIEGFGRRRSRLSNLSAPGDPTVFSMGGATGRLGSIWIVQWGEEDAAMLYPGDGGTMLVESDWTAAVPAIEKDLNGNPFRVDITNWSWEFGFRTVDDRALQRVANITLSGDGSIHDDAVSMRALDLLTDIVNNRRHQDNIVMYMPREILSSFIKKINRTNTQVTRENLWGRVMPTFSGIPMLSVDELRCDEAVVTA